ncbi:MAG: hypothetical protein ACYTED_20690 [Planctomycetota bacterium]
MRPHEKVQKQLFRFESVEWLYDGLKGRIIPWTKEHGGTSDDPSVQAFIVGRDGGVVSRCPDGRAYSASSFSKWLEEQADSYDRKFPRTKVPFAMAEVSPATEEERARCEALEEAREARTPILLYVGREPAPSDDRKAKAQVKACRKIEKGALGSKKAAEAAKGWALLRLDLSRAEHRDLAKGLGVEQAPALLMLLPDREKPVDLGTKLKGSNLAYHLKKNASVEDD